MPKTDNSTSVGKETIRPHGALVQFVVYGEEMLEKEVKLSCNSGRVYLPPDWVGKHVKIIRID
ncbi:MAG: DUF2080 family transposase-associated protein [Deltaproteobacteria bacterium]|nr:DUF2080 family transposase-associated protein [Deltaproteobacteria bacterium]